MALFAGNLLPASFRGVPFAVLADETGGGRRIALHQYPGRDDPWAEDMGRAARSFRFRGFIVDGDVVFAGGPIQLQRALLIAAFERSGSGLLTHPTLGPLTVSVARFAVGQDLGAGRMSSVDVEFVESGKRQFPSLLSTSKGLLSAANLGKLALAVDGVRAIALARAVGGRRRDLVTTAASWSTKAIELGGDATSLNRLAARLPGNFGRFAGGSADSTATLSELTAEASAARAAITTQSLALGAVIAASDLDRPGAIIDAASALVATLSGACSDPADAVRLLSGLAGYQPARPEAATAIGQAFGATMRRAAAAQLIAAVGTYEPTSADEALDLIRRLGALLDAVATEAADAGDQETFRALRSGRAAMIQDLRTRAASLARLRTFRPGAALPSLRLAQRYYRAPARADELEQRAGAVHPLFMPLQFEALTA